MRLLAITTCTNRKRGEVSTDLDVSSVAPGSQVDLAKEWRRRVAASKEVKEPASDVYCGRSFQEALFAVKGVTANIWIVSGGWGLVRGTDLIAPYNLSLARDGSSFVGGRVLGKGFDSASWWHSVQRGRSSTPIADLVRVEKDALFLIGLSDAYLTLIRDDLLSLNDAELKRIRLIGLSLEVRCPDRLQSFVLPYDDRLDGPDSPIPGTRGDFSSRAMHDFAENVFRVDPKGSIDDHKAAVTKRISKWRKAPRFSRQTRTDAEIIDYILKNWSKPGASASRALRHLRDVENIACEQGRFRDLFNRAVRQTSQ